MKKIINKTLKSFAILLLVGSSYIALAQPPNPPEGNGQGGGQSEKLNGGGAPSGSGVYIMAAFVLAYGAKRFYDFRKLQKVKN